MKLFVPASLVMGEHLKPLQAHAMVGRYDGSEPNLKHPCSMKAGYSLNWIS